MEVIKGYVFESEDLVYKDFEDFHDKLLDCLSFDIERKEDDDFLCLNVQLGKVVKDLYFLADDNGHIFLNLRLKLEGVFI